MGKAGRKSIYSSDFHPKMAKILAETGRIDRDVAKEIGISQVTLIEWKKKHPEFLKALKIGKKKTDDKVISALYKRAVGYEYEEVEMQIGGTKGKGKRAVTKVRKKVMPPETLACIFWLKNRLPNEWGDKQDIAVTMTVVDQIKSIFRKQGKEIGISNIGNGEKEPASAN